MLIAPFELLLFSLSNPPSTCSLDDHSIVIREYQGARTSGHCVAVVSNFRTAELCHEAVLCELAWRAFLSGGGLGKASRSAAAAECQRSGYQTELIVQAETNSRIA